MAKIQPFKIKNGNEFSNRNGLFLEENCFRLQHIQLEKVGEHFGFNLVNIQHA
jgi:hypothetical protein